MAGDWIKVEHATLDKPEIRYIARMLGVKHGEALELLLRFWVWADKNSVDGHVDGLVEQDVDDLLHCDGFAMAMVKVGWLSFVADPPSLDVPNFSSHNGESSKKRALSNRAQAKWRESSSTNLSTSPSTKASTREEKRRTNKHTELVEPTTEHRAQAAKLGLDCNDQFQRYRDWMASTGKSHKDQAAGFRNWLKNAKGIGPAKPLRMVRELAY